jgi:ATP-binding cassette subfamily C protein LapB
MSEADRRAWIVEIIDPLKPIFSEVMAFSLFVNILALAAPIFTLQVYDRVVGSGGLTTLQGLVIGMGVVVFFDLVLRQSRARIMQTVALKIDVIVGRKLFEKIVSLPLRTLETKPSAFWQILFRDVETVRNTLSGASAILVVDLPFTILFLTVMFIIATPLATVLMIAMPLFMFVAWRSGTVQQSATQKERKSASSRDTLIAEVIAARNTVKALSLDRAMKPLWEEKSAEAIEDAIVRGARNDGFVNMTASLSMITTIAVTTVGALYIVDHQLTMGALVASNMLMGRLLSPLNQLVGTWKTFAGFRQSVTRLGDVFTQASDNLKSAIQIERPKGKLSAEKVVFSYAQGAAPVLNEISLEFSPGLTAIIGPNGSGKTTFMKVMLGLYPCSSGRVLLDGADIAQFGRAELAGWLGYVPQECVLFSGSIRDNIAHGATDPSDDQIIKAATQSGVHAFIVDMPGGYATAVGEGGGILSGGQRQRLVIARALVCDPPVLLLDEPSSNLDRKAEEDLAKTLVALARTRTVLMVTHSPVLLSVCHRVVALDHGRVIADGPPAGILARLFGRPAAAQPAPAAYGSQRLAPVQSSEP